MTGEEKLFRTIQADLMASLKATDSAALTINTGIKKHFKVSEDRDIVGVKPAFGRSGGAQDSFVLTRKLGHAELLFNTGTTDKEHMCLDNVLGKWNLEAPDHECYVCKKWRYTCIYFHPR